MTATHPAKLAGVARPRLPRGVRLKHDDVRDEWLLLAPERVLEYVIWHEVCHLEVLDHSPRFWALLERRWPGYREDRDWLSRHGATLVL